MAEFDNVSHIGDWSLALTDAELTQLENFTHYAGLGVIQRVSRKPASYVSPRLVIDAQVPSGGSANGTELIAPWPFRLDAIDLCAETIGGSASAATLDVQVARWDGSSYGSYASILDAAEDVVAGGTIRVAPEDGEEQINYLDKLRLVGAATGDTLDGCSAQLWGQRT